VRRATQEGPRAQDTENWPVRKSGRSFSAAAPRGAPLGKSMEKRGRRNKQVRVGRRVIVQ
jgi:hypothetical protein